jgi:Mg2+ and Co2+ transporter CorA
MLLTAVVTGYQQAVDAIEADVDDLDARALRAARGDDRVLSDLVGLRRRIAELRRLLADQRETYAMLDGAETLRSMGEHTSPDLEAVTGRYEAALASVEDARDLLLGSFDVFMTRTAQRTNDSMKILTLATVILLPGSLIAGLLGMNLDIPLTKGVGSFWMVVLLVAAMAVTILVVARARRWI